MAFIGQQISRAYGFDSYVNVFPSPIRANGAPTSGVNGDQAIDGQIWIDVTNSDAYIMVNQTVHTWNKIEAAGAAGVFTSLTVTPGSTHLLSTDNTAGTIALQTNGGIMETIVLHNGMGTDPAAVEILADAGGITSISALQTLIESSQVAADAIKLAATNANGGVTIAGRIGGITLSAPLGPIALTSTENAANAIILTTDGGANETLVIHSNQGTLATSINLDSTVGGITATTHAATKDISLLATLGSVNITGGEAIGDAVVISASNAAGGAIISVGTGGLHMANQATATTIELANVIPTAARTTTVNGGTIGSAIADTLNLATDGATFAGSSKIVNIATGGLTLGTQTVNIASGAVTSGTQAVNVGTGTGVKTISLGNADGLTNIALNALKVTVAGTTVVINGRSGVGTLTGVATAAGGSSTLTITNSACTIASGIIVGLAVVGAEDAQMVVQKVRPNAGSITVLVTNEGMANLITDLIVSFIILS